jgi:hypothetical protein
MKKTFKAENWVNDEMTIEVFETERSFKMYDQIFKIVPQKDFDFYLNEVEMECFDIVAEDGDKIAWVGKDVKDTSWMGIAMDIHRTDKNIYIAAAKLLSNII